VCRPLLPPPPHPGQTGLDHARPSFTNEKLQRKPLKLEELPEHLSAHAPSRRRSLTWKRRRVAPLTTSPPSFFPSEIPPTKACQKHSPLHTRALAAPPAAPHRLVRHYGPRCHDSCGCPVRRARRVPQVARAVICHGPDHHIPVHSALGHAACHRSLALAS
jgi:hypothetical protein